MRFGLLLAAAALVVAAYGQQHHGHTHEAPHSKYGREVNEQAAAEAAAHDHGHSHTGGKCPHAHSHDAVDHGHSHGAEDHGHSHGAEDHGHSHGAEEHGHAHTGGKCPHSHGAEDHGHSHGAEDHGHSHGGQGHSHGAAKAKREVHPADSHQYEGALSFMNDARTRLWVHALGATLMISIAPFLILLFIPIQANTSDSGPLLKVLLAFGSGGLLGDAFLHLIPHAQPPAEEGGHGHSHEHHGHSHGPHDMSVGGWVLAGIIAFLTIEKLLRILRGGEHGHSHGGHGHSHGGKAKETDDEEEDEKKGGKKDRKKVEKKADAPKEHEGIKIAAYLNLAADFAHNFTDGLAIGASFIAGTGIGIVTTMTVLIHEVPHEIGDFAILVQSGYTKTRAMMIQLVTALGAFSGCLLSLWSADGAVADAASATWVLPFTAGGFIYIATVSVIPELLENSSLKQTVLEIIALLTGIYMMYLIAMYE
ncbi:unnamed protein product, partial [Mesorhabditis spiculigera]